MVRVTMMRGAQSGGTVTYVPSNGGERGSTGIRSCEPVVNGKRTAPSFSPRRQHCAN